MPPSAVRVGNGELDVLRRCWNGTLADADDEILKGLEARGLVNRSDSAVTVADASLFAAVFEPEVTVVAERRDAESELEATFLGRGDVGIQQHEVAGAQELEPFESGDLARRVLEFVALVPRPLQDAEPFTTTLMSIEALANGRGETPGHEIPPLFTAALAHGVGYARLDGLARSADLVVAAELAWIDGGESGLWRLEELLELGEGGESVHDGSTLRVEPADALTIVQEFLDFLSAAEQTAPRAGPKVRVAG